MPRRAPQARDGGRGGRLDEQPLGAREQAVGVEDLLVRHRLDHPAGLVARRKGALPACGIADTDCGGHRLRLGDGRAVDDGRGAGGLEAHHRRPASGRAILVILLEPLPIGGDVPRVPHGDEERVGRLAQCVHDLEGRRLLAFDAVRVQRVHQRNGVPGGHVADDVQGLVKVAVEGDELRPVGRRLGELARRHFAFGHDDDGAQAVAGRVGRRRGAGVARRGADDGGRARFHGLRECDDHAAVFERPRRVAPFQLEVERSAAGLALDVLGAHQWSAALAKRDQGRVGSQGQTVSKGVENSLDGKASGGARHAIVAIQAPTPSPILCHFFGGGGGRRG